jgi:hypothetical protein
MFNYNKCGFFLGKKNCTVYFFSVDGFIKKEKEKKFSFSFLFFKFKEKKKEF